jgi:hypothetical protein
MIELIVSVAYALSSSPLLRDEKKYMKNMRGKKWEKEELLDYRF